MVYAVADDRDAFGGKSEELSDIARGIIADRDEAILPVSQAPNDDPTIQHSLPVVFFGHSEGCQIMNGSNQAAWLAPKQTSITWHMQNIEPVLAHQAGQAGLMPKNILYWRTIFFRDDRDFHLVANKGKQREIFFQHK